MRVWAIRWAVLSSTLLGLAGCASNIAPTTTDTPIVTITQGFDGTVGKNGADTHQFPVSGSGTVQLVLNSLTPAETTAIGMSLGTFNAAGVCQIILAKDKTAVGDIVTGTVTTAGTLCVRMYDAGTVSQDTVYSVTVVHP